MMSECEICGEEKGEQDLIRHHITYDPEFVITVCEECHHKCHSQIERWELGRKERISGKIVARVHRKLSELAETRKQPRDERGKFAEKPWSQADTAELLGISREKVTADLRRY